jgi:hypothetical protein
MSEPLPEQPMPEPPKPVGAPPSFQCPTCGAAQSPSPECRRCRCDLSLVVALIAREESLRAQAYRCLASGDYLTAAAVSERLHQDAPSDASARLLSVGQLLAGHYDAARATCEAALLRTIRHQPQRH